MEEKVKFKPFTRVPEIPAGQVDLKIIEAVRIIKESTPHEVTFELTKQDVEVGTFFKRKPMFRITKLELIIKEPY